ncbi:NAD/NADP octopine/nopaline dehydrogenase (plasmid) [Burkholderia sp. JP2-270]|uniref:NAD/NADP octopine/nopaline dehydrogenase family protein n=1 Tax=Burkholderia sp. JP2-270 TaxID=2217913 RepID=UPI000DA2D646|nr:NAD/NADP octopine/nopaline dehydrogenase family protein [Burkholderia sp. JP2-270]AWV05619.1 NAD/NADP octopine/nopaline dehydrogenase [Burkholderia sp. JP2-270]
MQVTIAGAGAIALGYAAYLLENGHTPRVWSPSGARTVEFVDGAPLKANGAINGEFHLDVCVDAKDAADADIIILALPAYGHRFAIESLIPHIGARHMVVISGHLSLVALYLAKRLAERGLDIPIAAWSTTVLTCKSQSTTQIRVGAIRTKVDMAALPVRHADRVHKTCVSLFGDRFLLKDDMLTLTLSNINPQDHMGIALTNLTRIEKGEAWGQNSNLTPSVGKLLEALDVERISVATAFGKAVRTTFDHCRLSFDVGGDSLSEISTKLVERGSDPLGPTSIETRYVLEDVPFGLVPTLRLANLAGVSAPLHESGVAILGACYGRNFVADNDILPEIEPLDIDTLKRLVVDGYPARN